MMENALRKVKQQNPPQLDRIRRLGGCRKFICLRLATSCIPETGSAHGI